MIVGAHRADTIVVPDIMIDHYGAHAAWRAELRVAQLRALGEPGNAENWERVKTAIERLQVVKPAPRGKVQRGGRPRRRGYLLQRELTFRLCVLTPWRRSTNTGGWAGNDPLRIVAKGEKPDDA
jgi:hypothetical protein